MAIPRLERSALWNAHKARGKDLFAELMSAPFNSHPTLGGKTTNKSCSDTDAFKAQFIIHAYPHDTLLTADSTQRCHWGFEIGPEDDESVIAEKLKCYVTRHWSQMAWQHWVAACKTSNLPLSTLNAVRWDAIVSDATSILCNEALKPYLQGDTERAGKEITFGPNEEEFMVLLATPEATGAVHLFFENKSTLGFKAVKDITLYFRADNGGCVDMVLGFCPLFVDGQ